MSKFKCKCMNITVHVKEKATREADGKAFVSQPVKSTFFSLDLFEVELAVGGITKEVGSLVRETKIEDWNVFSCLNCKMDTHALHVVKKYDRVLISRKMESNPDVFNKNITSPKYSEVFKIVLAPVKSTEEVILDNSGSVDNAVLLGHQDTISLAMTSVQEHVKKYLEAEENSMNERIRKYTEEQKAQFIVLQSQAFKDKQAVYCTIKREEERSLESSLDEAIRDSSLDTPLVYKPEHPVAPRVDEYDNSLSQVHITQVASQKTRSRPPPHHPSHKTRKTPHKAKQHQIKGFSFESDPDPVFSLDDFTNDCEPFFESEEDDLSSDNSFQAEEHLYNPRLKHVKKATQYSTSVPITMPSGKNSPAEDDEFVIPEPSKIGESMRAIARSVHESSEALFGELPPPRRSTFLHR